jgi:succinate dehydrogenase subunit C
MKGKEYVRPMGANWWLQRPAYTQYMLREITALFVGGYAIFLIVLIYRATQGPEAFAAFVEGLKSPASIVLHLLTLAMALYHTVTWLNATPKALVFWRGEEKVAPETVIAGSYVVWIVLSVLVAGLAFAAAKTG